MVEKVARAIFEEEYSDTRRPRPDIEPQWILYRSAAIAALEAAREPTAAMKAAGDAEIPDNIGFANDACGVYRSMIDAALKDGE